MILAIPVHGALDNKVAWHFDKKGKFSVKSAYKVFKTDQIIKSRSGEASSSNPDSGRAAVWSKIWKTNCANKVKHFMWRFCHNSHPLRANLKRKGMKIDTRCVVCNRLDEDGAHLFFKCKYMSKVWDCLALSTERDTMSGKQSAREVTEYIMNMNDKKKTLCCTTLWLCWSERNSRREGEHECTPAGLAQRSQAIAREWQREDHRQTDIGIVRQHTIRWEKPQGDTVKVNCDVAFDTTTGNGGWGCIVRDSAGDVVSAYRGRTGVLLHALQGELIACIQGAQATIAAGIGHVVLETDAVEVTQAIYSEEYALSDVSNLVEELHSLLRWNFVSWRVQQRSRICNRVAHELAKLGSVCDQDDELMLVYIPTHDSASSE